MNSEIIIYQTEDVLTKEGEIEKDSVWAKFVYTASDGKEYQTPIKALESIEMREKHARIN